MARAKNPNLTFSSECGENISLSPDMAEASWSLRQSGNYMYASQCIEVRECVTENLYSVSCIEGYDLLPFSNHTFGVNFAPDCRNLGFTAVS